MRLDTAQAERFFLRYDHRIPPERYPLTAADESWLTGADRPAATVVFEVATRLGLAGSQLRARDRLAELLTDAASIVRAFDRWRALGVLDGDVVTRVLRSHPSREFAGDEQMWRLFFEHLPPELVAAALVGQATDPGTAMRAPAAAVGAGVACLRFVDSLLAAAGPAT